MTHDPAATEAPTTIDADAASAIAHVSDTALWVAAYRAWESERPDAAFRDPFARTLAGDRGEAIARSFAATEAASFAMATRTTAIDRLIEGAIAQGADLVLNLGAGLCARPYRMALPPALRWVELDFPAMIAYKAERLADARPACDLRRLGVDLADDATRRRALAEAVEGATKVLVLTEGLVAYLTPGQAEALARDLHALPAVAWWIQDVQRGPMRRVTDRNLAKLLEQSPIRFDVSDPLAFFARLGWRTEEVVGILDEADRIGRPFPAMPPWNHLMRLLPRLVRPLGNMTYAYVRFGR